MKNKFTPFAEETILRVAFAYEQATEWHRKKPNLRSNAVIAER